MAVGMVLHQVCGQVFAAMCSQVSGTNVAQPVSRAFSRIVRPGLLRIAAAGLQGTEVIVGHVEAASMCTRTTASPRFTMLSAAVRITSCVTGSGASCNIVDAVVLTAP